jgi:hypothetical protein
MLERKERENQASKRATAGGDAQTKYVDIDACWFLDVQTIKKYISADCSQFTWEGI